MKKILVLAAAVTVSIGLGMGEARADHNWGLNDDYQPGPQLTPVMSSKAGPMVPTGRDDHHVDAADHYRQLGIKVPKG